jgi:hypothetical protein
MRDFWANHPEGSRIAVVYSKSKPSISGVKYQVEQKRQALAKRGGRIGLLLTASSFRSRVEISLPRSTH